jgi:heavy metal translocating P-type ATPase
MSSFVTVDSDETLHSQPRCQATVSIGGMTCSACVNIITEELKKQDWISKVAVNLVTNSATVELCDQEKKDGLLEAIEDLGYDATLDSIVNLNEEPTKPKVAEQRGRVSLAIGGMTCSRCVNVITEELQKLDWLSNVAINLVSNSGTAEVRDKKDVDRLVEAIEDLGYEATVDSVVSVAQETPTGHERTVEIRIDGIYCEHCPFRVTNSLSTGFQQRLEALQQPTMQRPIVKVRYTPEAPRFTVRHILAAIEASDPALAASIYHPPTLEERSKQIRRKHQKEIFFRVILTFVICIPTFVIGIVYMSLVPSNNHGRMLLMKPWTSGISRAQIALFILATPVYFFGADIFHKRAFKEIKNLWRRGSRTPLLQRFYRFGSMNTLMSLGTTIAYVSSVCQMIAAAANQADEIEDSNFYFDSVVFLTFFLLLGRLIESYSKSKTGDAVEMLGKLRPTTANLVEGCGTEKEMDSVVQADLLEFGDVVRIPHGNSPPADGVVVQGETNFNESSLTGESRLVKKVSGDEVFAGTVNQGGPVLVKITGVAGSSMLDQIVKVVREGQTKRAPMEALADQLTTYFVPTITAVAILTWIIWMSLGFSGRIPGHFLDASSGGWAAFSLQFAIAVFVVGCPCGLALAAPTAIFVGSGLAAKHGILAKGGGEAFEKASRIDVVVFDKTGTLTEGGEPTITDHELCPDSSSPVSEDQKCQVLAAMKAVEESSSHPIAKSIVAFCSSQTTMRLQASEIEELPGKGMKASFRGTTPTSNFTLLIGNESLMTDFSVPITPRTQSLLERWKSEAKSIALAAISPLSSPSGWSLSAILSISDPLRPSSARVVSTLQRSHIQVYLLSGDNAVTAAAVGRQLSIPPDNIIAGVLPTSKASHIARLQSSLHHGSSTTRRATIAMVGDGINDSPALATADVGIAVASGSDVAISSADFVLVNSDLEAVVTLLGLSRTVFRRIKFNFGWAVVYNLIAVPIAAGVLYPVRTAGGGHVKLDPVWASLAMALSSISVVCSSLLLRSRLPGVGYRPKVSEIEE